MSVGSFRGNCESTNLGRDDLSRETGRSRFSFLVVSGTVFVYVSGAFLRPYQLQKTNKNKRLGQLLSEMHK